jgi:hypothetical protein
MKRVRVCAAGKSIGGLILGIGALIFCVPAQAADPATEPVPATGSVGPTPLVSEADQRPITVALHTESTELTLDAVRAAVAEELGVRTVTADSKESFGSRGVLTVTYRASTRELAITYSEVERGTITRIVPAPDRVEDVPLTAALVAGNLVRNQAADLLNKPVPPAPPILIPAPTLASMPAPAATATPLTPPTHWLGNASLFYPLATNYAVPELRTNFDFNLLYGHIGRLDGFELGTVSTVGGDARGIQLSVLTNLVGGNVRAGQVSTLFNRGRAVEGFQIALVNRADQALQGVQGGALNLAHLPSAGLQIGGLNLAGDLSGLQLGIVNVGGHVEGMQVGLVNVADDVDGVPIGLVSVSRVGGVHPVVWTSDTTYANVGVKFATRYTYTMLSGAVHTDGERALYGGGLTIGASIPIAARIFVDMDVQGLHLFANTDCCRNRFSGALARQYDQSLAKVRASVRFELLEHFSLFAGAGVTGRVTYPLRGADTEVKLGLVPEFFGGVQL